MAYKVNIWSPVETTDEQRNALEKASWALRHALSVADSVDVVVTVRQVSKEPFAMGHYDTIGEVRLARVWGEEKD